MLHLPIELRRLCFEALEHAPSAKLDEYGNYDYDDNKTPTSSNALKNLRLVNKDFCALATDQLFRTAILNHTDESAAKFVNLTSSTHATLIRRVIINTSDDPDYSGGGQDETEILEGFQGALSKLKGLSNLEEVDLRFAQECATDGVNRNPAWSAKDLAESTDFRDKVLKTSMSALRREDPICTLTIKNLQDDHRSVVFQSEDFSAVRDSITKLHLQIATEDCEGDSSENLNFPAVHRFFNQDLSGIWLAPLSHQLTHLSLYSAECPWGFWPFVDLRTMPTFPKLKSLNLGNFTVVYDWQVDWIVAHKATLENLVLDRCLIGVALQVFPQHVNHRFQPPSGGTGRGMPPGAKMMYVDIRWHHVFERFQSELLRLSHFAFGSGNWRGHNRSFEERGQLASRLLPERYGVFDMRWSRPSYPSLSNPTVNGWDVRLYKEKINVPYPDCLDDDKRALAELIQTVSARDNS